MSMAKLKGLGLRRIKTRMQRAYLRWQLLNRQDRILEDMGFSRQLLDEGVRAWPWREEIAENDHRQPGSYEQAVQELRAYSDAERADLGLKRSAIEHAVRHGRPGIDDAGTSLPDRRGVIVHLAPFKRPLQNRTDAA